MSLEKNGGGINFVCMFPNYLLYWDLGKKSQAGQKISNIMDIRLEDSFYIPI